MPNEDLQVGNPQPIGFIRGEGESFARPNNQTKSVKDIEMPLSDNEVNLRLKASEAATETKIVRLESKLELVSNNINHLSENIMSALGAQRQDLIAAKADATANRNLILGTVVGGFLTIVALFYAALSYGSAQFYNGSVVRDIARDEASKAAGKSTAAASSTPSEGAAKH